MANITEKQLIESLSQLKEIKPRKEWAVLLKSQILSEREVAPVQAKSVGIMDIFQTVFSQRKLAYSFAVVLLLIFGAFGATRLLSDGNAERQVALKQNVAAISTKITELTKDLNADSFKDVASAKKLADGVQTIKKLQAKTFADMPGTPEEKSLTDAIASIDNTLAPLVKNEINDLNNTTLTDAQKNILTNVQKLYDQGKYAEALEEILLINQ